MLLAHKIELRPTAGHIQYLDMACGHRRHCYNQLLAHFSHPENKWSKAAGYQHFMRVIRPTFPWYNEVSSRVTRNAIDDLDNAFSHFFRRVKKGQTPGFSRFKRRGVRDSFALREAEKFDVAGRELRIEKLKTKIKMRQRLRFAGQTKQVTISKHAGKYFASILVETNEYDPQDHNREAIGGVDLGIKELAVISNGTIFPANQCLKSNLNRLARLQRKWHERRKEAIAVCSGCGQLKNDLTLSERLYSCDCGVNMDRDFNAANNLKEYGRHALQGGQKRTKESRQSKDHLGKLVDIVNNQ